MGLAGGIRVKATNGCTIAAVARKESGQKAGIKFRRMPIIYRNLWRAERLNQTSNQLKNVAFLFFAEKRCEFGSQQLLAKLGHAMDQARQDTHFKKEC